MMDLLSVIVCALLHLNRVLMKLRTPTYMLSYLLTYEMNPSLHDYLVLNDYFVFCFSNMTHRVRGKLVERQCYGGVSPDYTTSTVALKIFASLR